MGAIKYIIKLLFIRPFYFVKSRKPVWRFLNGSSIALQEQNPLPLDAKGEEIVAALKRDGIYATHIDEFFPNSNWFEELSAYAREQEANAQRSEKKAFFNDMWDMNNFTLDLKNPFVRFTFDDKIIAIANAYFGMYSWVHSLRLMKTFPVKEGDPGKASQLWHRDNGNIMYFKVFLYLNDVDERTGPFIYVKGSQPGGRHEQFYAQNAPYSPKDPRVPEEAVAKEIPEEDILVCTGKKGSLIFVDTVGLHKGGYSIDNERFTLLSTFFTKVSFTTKEKADKFIYPDSFNEDIKSLSPQAQYSIARQ